MAASCSHLTSMGKTRGKEGINTPFPPNDLIAFSLHYYQISAVLNLYLCKYISLFSGLWVVMLLALLFSLFWLFPLWFCEFAVQLYHASTVVFLNWNYKLFIEPKLVVFLFPTVWVSWHLHLQCLFSFLNQNCHHITSSSFFFSFLTRLLRDVTTDRQRSVILVLFFSYFQRTVNCWTRGHSCLLSSKSLQLISKSTGMFLNS